MCKRRSRRRAFSQATLVFWHISIMFLRPDSTTPCIATTMALPSLLTVDDDDDAMLLTRVASCLSQYYIVSPQNFYCVSLHLLFTLLCTIWCFVCATAMMIVIHLSKMEKNLHCVVSWSECVSRFPDHDDDHDDFAALIYWVRFFYYPHHGVMLTAQWKIIVTSHFGIKCTFCVLDLCTILSS